MLAVGHPNGTLAKITAIKSLRLTSGIVLFNVLVILEYSVSLLSVNKMIKDSKFFVGFDEHKCYIKDLNLEKIMGLAKQTREPFPLSDHKSKLVDDMVHCDVWGPYRVISKDGFRFFLTIVHDFSRAVWVYLLKSKAEVGEYVESFIKLIFTQFRKKIKIAKVMPIKFSDYVVSSHVKYGLEKYVSYANLSRRNFCFSTTLSKSIEPKTFNEDSQNPKWIEAMNLEIEALHRNNTYILADLLPRRNTSTKSGFCYTKKV
ncbi:ribonuclease H-like domain-containing protein [Tanacetum coccineum]|uniref:Ribonuclease H-like domain-containing protein n=1 Tax=Tanacetum coccineum TaxID=301880 RepID=A0ABQ5D736_9ASTR